LISACTKAAKSSGLLAIGETPSLASRCVVSGSRRSFDRGVGLDALANIVSLRRAHDGRDAAALSGVQAITRLR
jgi:hypothetical protein